MCTRAASWSADEKRTPDKDYLERVWKKQVEKVLRAKRERVPSPMGDMEWNSRSLHYFAAFWRACTFFIDR